MTIKIEITDEEAHALLAYHATEISKFPYGERTRSARVHDIMKRIERSYDKEREDSQSKNSRNLKSSQHRLPLLGLTPERKIYARFNIRIFETNRCST